MIDEIPLAAEISALSPPLLGMETENASETHGVHYVVTRKRRTRAASPVRLSCAALGLPGVIRHPIFSPRAERKETMLVSARDGLMGF